jgi:integrase
MASLYTRGDTIWINYKSEDGKWKNKSTGYRQSNPGERRAAEKLRDRVTLRERSQRPMTKPNGGWIWVDDWIETAWGASTGTTPQLYQSQWRTLQHWLKEADIPGPVNVTREACLSYPTWREEHHGGRNTAVGELKLFAQILEEGVRRGYCTSNPARKLGLKRAPAAQRRAWTEDELAKVDAHLAKHDPYGFLRVTYLLGRYQAARLRSCAVPLADIDLERSTIYYREPKGGRKKAFSQPIDKRLLPVLTDIVAHRRAIGATKLCDIPQFPSIEWRHMLDSLGINGVSQHDLRRTWITRAAMANIPESVAMKFSGHSSSTVHQVYQAFSTSDVASMLDRLA